MTLQRTSAWLLVAVGASAGIFWAVTGPLQARLESAQAKQVALDTEAAALRGRIEELGVIGEDRGPAKTLLLAGSTRAEAAAALQERLGELARQHDVQMTSVSEATVPEGLSHPATAVVIEGEGSLEKVIRLLAALEAQSPPIGFGQLMIRRQDAGQVSLRLMAWGLLHEDAG